MKKLMTIVFAVLALNVSFAKESNKWEGIIGKPPILNSFEEKSDFQKLLNLQEKRTKQQCANAKTEVHITLESLFGGQKGPLTEKEVKRLKGLFIKYYVKMGLVSKKVKKHYSRQRPYQRFLSLKPCIDKSGEDNSFPSGHTSISRILAYALAKKFPERKDQFFKRANEVAFHRMLGGVHFPTDVAAGKKLADHFARKWGLSK